MAKLDKQKKDKEKKLKDLNKKQEVAQRKEKKRLAKAREEKKRLAREVQKRKVEDEKRRKAEEDEMFRQAMAAEAPALLDEQMAAEDAKPVAAANAGREIRDQDPLAIGLGNALRLDDESFRLSR